MCSSDLLAQVWRKTGTRFFGLYFATMMAWACKPCSSSDPASDTVKVDYSKFATGGENSEDKENAAPNLAKNDKMKDEAKSEAKSRAEAERQERELEQQRVEQVRRRQEQEKEQRRLEEAAETNSKEEEDRRRFEEEQEQLHQQEQLRQQEEAQRQQEIEQAAQRELEEQERKRAEEQRAKDEQDAQQRVNAWLKKNGFSSVNAKKKSMMSSLYPLHCAVTQNDSAMVQLLIRFGADPKLTNSSKQTPRQMADKLNKKGSHNEVLAVLPSA